MVKYFKRNDDTEKLIELMKKADLLETVVEIESKHDTPKKEGYNLFNRGHSQNNVDGSTYTDYKEDQLIILGNLELATGMIDLFIRYKDYQELNKTTTYDDYR